VTEAFNPVTVERGIDEVTNNIVDTVDPCDAALVAFLEADLEYDLAFAHAFLAHKGAQTEKKYAAEIATSHLRKERDVAYAASKRADRQARALESRLSGLQTIGKSVNSAYNVVGARS
jgi:hypothetical protein